MAEIGVPATGARVTPKEVWGWLARGEVALALGVEVHPDGQALQGIGIEADALVPLGVGEHRPELAAPGHAIAGR